MAKDFFGESKEQSRIKTQIVAKYFAARCRALKGVAKKRGGKLGYADFFAGPGRYDDDTDSTPILVLKEVLKDPELHDMFVSLFNDSNPEFVANLKQMIEEMPEIASLKHKPWICNLRLDGAITKEFAAMSEWPTLFFLDPWGYRGISCDMIQQAIKNFACEAIFFFNYNQINWHLNTDAVKHRMDALFGADRASSLRLRIKDSSAAVREAEILNTLCQAIMDCDEHPLVLPFRFLKSLGNRTSHHIVFVTKNQLGYDIMKDVMASASVTDGFASVPFSFVPASPQQDFLYRFNQSEADLENDLLKQFAGKILSANQIYQLHNVGTPFLKKHYRSCLKNLYEQKIVKAVNLKRGTIRKGSFRMDTLVSFPRENASADWINTPFFAVES